MGESASTPALRLDGGGGSVGARSWPGAVMPWGDSRGCAGHGPIVVWCGRGAARRVRGGGRGAAGPRRANARIHRVGLAAYPERRCGWNGRLGEAVAESVQGEFVDVVGDSRGEFLMPLVRGGAKSCAVHGGALARVRGLTIVVFAFSSRGCSRRDTSAPIVVTYVEGHGAAVRWV
ncbi:unnamed protein product [Boreogadus saida]